MLAIDIFILFKTNQIDLIVKYEMVHCQESAHCIVLTLSNRHKKAGAQTSMYDFRIRSTVGNDRGYCIGFTALWKMK